MTTLDIHAIQSKQGGIDVYTFFMEGGRILEIAELARIGRDKDGQIAGFQRPEILAHVRSIADYLDRGDVLFPNALILALGPGVRFSAKRGTKNRTADPLSQAGVLSIPFRPGRKAAWIVDGQQRALALAQTRAAGLPVPVVAFVSGDLAIHREQFILVNKARPLDRRLIDELLPTVGAVLSRDLSSRRVPSALCSALNDTPDSPFYGLIKRPSAGPGIGVVTDSHLTNLMRRSVQDPRGALAQFVTPDGSADLEAMYQLMVEFWSAVRDVFPTAWGLPPERSRLMHGVGLAAMGVLMDQIMTRDSPAGGYALARAILIGLSPHCRWTDGRWDTLGRDWNDLQCTAKDIRGVSNLLVGLERELARREAA
jgi:DGQHR domain-containing protein